MGSGELLSQRLSGEIAMSTVIEKMLLARRAVLAGMREPNVANNIDAKKELNSTLSLIDNEIYQIRLEVELQKMITSNTATAILNNKINF